jgi:hypothetical protein
MNDQQAQHGSYPSRHLIFCSLQPVPGKRTSFLACEVSLVSVDISTWQELVLLFNLETCLNPFLGFSQLNSSISYTVSLAYPNCLYYSIFVFRSSVLPLLFCQCSLPLTLDRKEKRLSCVPAWIFGHPFTQFLEYRYLHTLTWVFHLESSSPFFFFFV